MEYLVRIQIERLPEGVYLATSEEVQGLVAQGRTAAEALDIARDVVTRLLEAKREREGSFGIPELGDRVECTVVVGA